MAFCINCGQELAEGAKFCGNCGTAVNNDSTTQRKTVYDGELHKCPNCGELLNSFVTNCPTCSYELRSVKTNSPVKELAEKIENATTVDEKNELITNFYVPNTKEDIYDFFILAVSNLEDDRYDTDNAWKAKLEQTYHKAKISFGNTPEFEYIQQSYNKTLSKVSKKGFSNFVKKNVLLLIAMILVAIGLAMIIIGIVIFSSVSMEENWWAVYGAIWLFILGIGFIFSPLYTVAPFWIMKEVKKNRKK